MKKSLLNVILAAALTATCLSFTACGGENYSETYTGTLSEATYSNEEQAAQAFFANEISGNSATLIYQRYEKQADLSESEIAALDLGEETQKPASAEVGKVYYTAQPAARAAASEEAETNRLYVLNYKNYYKYYSPALEIGEPLTASYFNSVINPEKYKAYTLNMEYEQSQKNIHVKETYIMKTNDNGAYMCCNSIDENENYKGFEETYYCPAISGHNQVSYNIDNYTPSKEWRITHNDSSFSYYNYYMFYDLFFGLSMQNYSAFVKTKTGFKLNEDKHEFNALVYPANIDYNINISNGKIKDGVFNMNYIIENTNCFLTVTVNFDHNSPTIVIPDEVKALLPQQ